eukprot:gene1442-2063_t
MDLNGSTVIITDPAYSFEHLLIAMQPCRAYNNATIAGHVHSCDEDLDVALLYTDVVLKTTLPIISSAFEIQGRCAEATSTGMRSDGRCQLDGNDTYNILTAVGISGCDKADAIYACPTLTLRHLALVNGYSESASGGAVLLEFANLVAFNSSFERNYAFNSGGALHAHEAADDTNQIGSYEPSVSLKRSVQLTQCLFIANNADTGGAVSVSGSRLDLDMVVFEDNFGNTSGGAVTLQNYAALVATRCTFRSNRVLIINIDSEDLDDRVIMAFGGAASIHRSHTTFDACLFENNTAARGGALEIDDGGDYVLQNCTFKGNSARCNTENCEVTRAVEDVGYGIGDQFQYGTGGAIDVFHGQPQRNSSVTVHNCTFHDNVASQSGGAVQIGVLGVRPQAETKNAWKKIEKGERNEDSARIHMSNSTFIENYANHGGGVRLMGGGSAFFRECNFVENVVRFNGSAISMHIESDDDRRWVDKKYRSRDTPDDFFYDITDTALTIEECTFEQNNAGSYVLQYNGYGTVSVVLHPEHFAKIIVHRSNFMQNRATFGGGAIRVSNGAEIVISDCTFDANVASYGGALYDDGSEDAHHTGLQSEALQTAQWVVASSSFTENSVDEAGAVMYVGKSHLLEVLFEDCMLRRNVAEGPHARGGVFAFEYDIGLKLVLVGSMVEDNRVLESSDNPGQCLVCPSVGTGEASLAGAVLFVKGEEVVRVKQSISSSISELREAYQNVMRYFDENVTSEDPASLGRDDVSLLDSTKSSEEYSYRRTIHIEDTRFVNNSAAEHGGVFFVDDNMDINVINCEFEANEANEGGVGFLTGMSKTAFSKCMFVSNNASRGGALTLKGNDTYVYFSSTVNESASAVFTKNTAVNGAVFFLETNTVDQLILESAEFFGNIASNGGGIFFVTSKTLVPNCTADFPCNMTGNEAGYGPVKATPAVTWNVRNEAIAVQSGTEVAEDCIMYDEFDQEVFMHDAAIPVCSIQVQQSVSSASNLTISGRFENVYTNGTATLSTGLRSEEEGSVHTLAYSLSTFPDDIRYLEVKIEQCVGTQEWDADAKECKCIEDSEHVALSKSKYCICKSGYFLSVEDGESAGTCMPCTDGGRCPGDNIMYAYENNWREDLTQDEFYTCQNELCLAQTEENVMLSVADEPLSNNAKANSIAGGTCKQGHEGPLCSVCLEGWAYQGEFCEECAESSKAENWEAWQFAVLIALCIIFHVILHIIFLWWPFMGRIVKNRANRAYSYAERRMSIMTDEVNRRMSINWTFSPPASDSPSTSPRAAPPGINDQVVKEKQDYDEKGEEEDADNMDLMQNLYNKYEGLLTSIRAIVNFLQIVTSFTKTMNIPWPSTFYSFSAIMSIFRLNLIQLPAMACTSPEPSFYSIMMFYVISFSCVCVYIVVVGFYGAWFKSEHPNLEKFKNICLNRLVFVMYLGYPSLSATILSTFACQELYGTHYLRSDYRIKCGNEEYVLHAIFASVCACVFVLGIPGFFVYLLEKHSVRQLAKVKYDNACFLELLWYAVRQGVIDQSVPKGRATTQEVPAKVVDIMWKKYCSTSSLSGVNEGNEVPMDRDGKLQALLQKAIQLDKQKQLALPEMAWGGSDMYNDPTDDTFVEREKLAIKRVGFLIEMYQVKYWYWEIVEMTRKFLLTSAIVFVDPGTATQVTVALIICVIMYNAYSTHSPFKLDEVDEVSQVAMADMTILVFIGLLLKVEVTSDNDGYFYNALVGILCIGAVVYPLFMSCKDLILGIALDLYNGNFMEATFKVKGAVLTIWSTIGCLQATSEKESTANAFSGEITTTIEDEVAELDVAAEPEEVEQTKDGEHDEHEENEGNDVAKSNISSNPMMSDKKEEYLAIQAPPDNEGSHQIEDTDGLSLAALVSELDPVETSSVRPLMMVEDNAIITQAEINNQTLRIHTAPGEEEDAAITSVANSHTQNTMVERGIPPWEDDVKEIF